MEALGAAVQYRHPVYDLLYAVLARRSNSGVLTSDSRLKALLGRMKVELA